jgi:hypothetical protein
VSVFNRITAEELKANFTHRGWMFGFAPVYVGDLGSHAPNVETRNWVPDFLFDLGAALFAGFCIIATTVAPDFEPSFEITVTGRLDGKPLEQDL